MVAEQAWKIPRAKCKARDFVGIINKFMVLVGITTISLSLSDILFFDKIWFLNHVPNYYSLLG